MAKQMRLTDEALLDVVRRRAAGERLQDVAQEMGATEIFLRVATNRVRKDDLDYSGEPACVVRPAYWGRK